MSDLCDHLESLRQRRHLVTPEELRAVLEEAGFSRMARLDYPRPFYKHPDLPGVRLTLRDDVPELAAGTVAKAIAAIEEVVDCDDR
jgi:hypothetical protein